MKPFRGKPEKPESSKEEIQRVSLCASAAWQTIVVRDGRSLCRRCVTNVCTSPPVGRRDPLGVGLRPAVEPVRFGVQTRGVPADCSTVV